MRHILVAATMLGMSVLLTFAMAAVIEHRALNTVATPSQAATR